MSIVREGYVPYHGRKTYFRVVDPDVLSNKAPLLCLHGGPGSTHNYFEVLDEVADRDNRTIIMYDQIGCGNSYLEGMRPDFWTPDLWLDELETVREYLELETVHILGQSWGGMMAIKYAVDRHPNGVKSYILSSTNPSSSMWESEGRRRIKLMSREDQAAIEVFLDGYIGEDDPGYIRAVYEYMARYCNPSKGSYIPECLTRPRRTGNEAYKYAWGSNEFTPTGPLAEFEYLDKLHAIETPCFVASGVQDLCSPLIAKAMYDELPDAQWILYPHSHHICYIDDHDQYVADLIAWLNEHDA